jgi:Flp pilus assembly pilin Flp
VQRLYETWLLLPATRLLGLVTESRGQTLAEYGLLVTLIAVAVVVASTVVFRNELITAYNSASTCLDGSC